MNKVLDYSRFVAMMVFVMPFIIVGYLIVWFVMATLQYIKYKLTGEL